MANPDNNTTTGATTGTTTSREERYSYGGANTNGGSIRDDLDQVGSDVRRLASKAQDGAKRAMYTVQDQVRTHPAMALGIAAGAGVLVGMMLANNNHRRNYNY